MTPKEQAAGVMKLISMMNTEAMQELAWMLHERSETARDRLGNQVCKLHEMTGGMFRIVHEHEREDMIGRFTDETRRLHGVREELIPLAAKHKSRDRKRSPESIAIYKFIESNRPGLTLDEAIEAAQKQKQWKGESHSKLKSAHRRVQDDLKKGKYTLDADDNC